MNTETTAQELISLPPAERAAVALQSAKAAAELTALVESSQSIVAITNPAGRTECHAAAMTAKAARVAIEKAGKEARDDATAFSKAVIAEEKRLVAIIEPEQNRLLTLRDDWDAKIEAEKESKRREEAEKAAAITRKIDAIKAIPLEQMGKASTEIRAAVQYVKGIEIDDSYGDQFGAAKEARGDVILKLIDMADAAEEREEADRVAAENKRLADEQAAREKAERDAEAQRQLEENERIRAENERLRADNEAAAEKLKAERETFEQQQAAAAKAERDRLDREAAEQHAADALVQLQQANTQAALSPVDHSPVLAVIDDTKGSPILAAAMVDNLAPGAASVTAPVSPVAGEIDRSLLISDLRLSLMSLSRSELLKVVHYIDRLQVERSGKAA